MAGQHRVIAADQHSVPRPFRAFAVRSEEAHHAWNARAPWGCVHRVRVTGLAAPQLARLAAEGLARVTQANIVDFSDIEHAPVQLDQLTHITPEAAQLGLHIAQALQLTGVLGSVLAPYQHVLAARTDFLVCRGAGFHNDVSGHWPRCLFWVLVLGATEVEFVMPHAGVNVLLAPGDLIVFDQTMAHGLCRPADRGQAVHSSFTAGVGACQVFLTGEIPLADHQWAAIGSPWLPVDSPDHRGSLDLMVAEFDDRSGAIKRPSALANGMKRSTCHVAGWEEADGAGSVSGARAQPSSVLVPRDKSTEGLGP